MEVLGKRQTHGPLHIPSISLSYLHYCGMWYIKTAVLSILSREIHTIESPIFVRAVRL